MRSAFLATVNAPAYNAFMRNHDDEKEANPEVGKVTEEEELSTVPDHTDR